MYCFRLARNLTAPLLITVLFAIPVTGQDPFGDDPFAQKPVQNNKDEANKDKTKPANANEPQVKPKTEKEKFVEQLDEIEADLEEEQKQAKYGQGAVEQFAEELKQEYFQNKDALDNGELEKKTRAGFERRQKHLSLYLWELERVGPALTQRRRIDPNSPRMRLSKLMTANRELLKDRPLMKRVSDLLRKSSQFGISSSRSSDEFYFVQPTQTEEKAAPVPNRDPFGRLAALAPLDPKTMSARLDGALRLLLKIGYLDGRLTLDQNHWKEPFAGKTLKEVSAHIEQELQQYGVNLNAVAPRRTPASDKPHGVLIFENMQHTVVKYGGSRSASGSSTEWNRSFSSSGVDAKFTFTPTLVEFSLRGRLDRSNTLHVLSKSTGELKVTAITGDHVFVLTQKADGKIQYADINDGEPFTVKADSFAQLYAKHPKVVQDQLFSHLTELGFITPLQRDHPEFVSRVILQINPVTDQSKTRFKELLDEIGGSSFSKRASATRELEKNLDAYLPLVLAANRKDLLPQEVKSRLKVVLEDYNRNWRETDALINAMKLDSDVSYLVDSMSGASAGEKSLIANQLKKVTSEDFGSDVQAWKNWLAKQ